MEAFVLIGAGGFVGANVRYLVSTWAAGRFSPAFPTGTLIANATGSFLMGLLLGILANWYTDDSNARLLLATGFLGSETTFSTFSFESIELLRQGDLRRATANVLGNTTLGLGGAAFGLLIARAVSELV